MSRHSISGRWILAIWVILSFECYAVTLRARQDISAELARAQSLFYGAEFKSALALLLDLERQIKNDPERASERLEIEMYLGLSYLGLNQTEQAKSKFAEVCALDGNYALDPMEFAPRVIALFEDANASCRENACTKICVEVGTLTAEGKLDAAQERLQAAGHSCSCAAASAQAIGEARFGRAKDLYNRDQFADAAKGFAAVLELDGTNEIAREYLRLSKLRLELTAPLAFAEWRANFNNRQFPEAAEAYRKIRSLKTEQIAAQLATQIESEYRNVLSGLVGSWKLACAAGDRTEMESLRNEVQTVASGLELGAGVLLEMQQCTSQRCIQGDPALALRRLKQRINPQIDPSLQRYLSRVRVDIEIGKDGAVTVKQITNANTRLAEALKSALEQWEFYPAVIDNQPRCVETELPISLIQP